MEQSSTVNQVFENKLDRLPAAEYNYERYTREDAMMDMRGTLSARGIGPGCLAPDFELEDTDGGRVKLSALRGKPVILRFGNIS